MKALNVGYNNAVSLEKVVAVINADSKPARRLKERAEREGRLVDATSGRKTRSCLITSSNHLVLCSLNNQTILQRINEQRS
jgi:extracellular matrix regulatory protein A